MGDEQGEPLNTEPVNITQLNNNGTKAISIPKFFREITGLDEIEKAKMQLFEDKIVIIPKEQKEPELQRKKV